MPDEALLLYQGLREWYWALNHVSAALNKRTAMSLFDWAITLETMLCWSYPLHLYPAMWNMLEEDE